jgi:hypothetical protein
MVLRLTFFLLVFANLVFFAWAQGYFGGGDPNREPDRLVQQLQPEKLRIISSTTSAVGAGADSRRRQRRACLPRGRRPQHG